MRPYPKYWSHPGWLGYFVVSVVPEPGMLMSSAVSVTICFASSAVSVGESPTSRARDSISPTSPDERLVAPDEHDGVGTATWMWPPKFVQAAWLRNVCVVLSAPVVSGITAFTESAWLRLLGGLWWKLSSSADATTGSTLWLHA